MEIYKEARNDVQRLIKYKKKKHFEKKLAQNIAKPKKLWQALKSLVLPNKKTSQSNICLENKDGLLFDSFLIAETFKKNHSSRAENLVLKLPKPSNKSRMESVNNYYEKYNLKEKLIFANNQSDKVFKTLKNFDETKASSQVSMIWQKYFLKMVQNY